MNRMEMISHLFFLINDIWDASCFPSSLCYVLDLVDEKWRWDLQKTTELDRNSTNHGVNGECGYCGFNNYGILLVIESN